MTAKEADAQNEGDGSNRGSAKAGSTEAGWADRITYLFVLSRPRFWFYLAGPVLVGVAYGAGSVTDLFGREAVLLFAYFLIPANVFLYGVNDVFDREVDRRNPKKESREVRYDGERFVPYVIAAGGALLVPVALSVPTVAWPWLAGFLLLGTAYSAPPIRFKTTPLLDSVSNGLYILPGAAAYAAVAVSHPPTLAVIGGWLWAMGMHTFSAIPDIAPDRAAGIETTATVLGELRSYGYCAACWLAAAFAFGMLDARIGAVLFAYPVLITIIATARVDVARAYWWFPAINTAVGAALTMGGLWRIVYG